MSSLKKTRSDFIFLKTIGEGSFSTVYLAEEKSSGLKFAIKECDKYQILKEKKAKYVHLEKKILAQHLIDHPFVIKLYFTFQDEDSLYFGLNYCPNGDLLDFMKKHELEFKTKNYAQFYSAEIVSALEFIHSKNIIHRDLKPENILLDGRKHIKITDFGTARILDDEEVDSLEKKLENASLDSEASATDGGNSSHSPTSESLIKKRSLGRRNSFVGTAQFVAPEILQGKQPHKGCDLWSLGCIVYQMFTTKHCFTGHHEYDIFQKIIKLSYTLPDDMPPDARKLIEKLIVSDPSMRLGVEEQGGYAKLKENEFFMSISDWSNLNEQNAPSELNEEKGGGEEEKEKVS